MNPYLIHILTLFPDFFRSPLQTSLMGKAIQKNILAIDVIDLREYAVNQHGQVDDAPYGGGPGMVLMVEPIDKAVLMIRKKTKSHVILLTPRGRRFSQQIAEELLQKLKDGLSLSIICGHYEGVDERVAEIAADESISIGDFILSGGESAALGIVESVARMLPNFVGNRQSLETESFSKKDYIEYPQYTRPVTYRGVSVPDVLQSGHHEKIKKWREENSCFKGSNGTPKSIIDDDRQKI